ncbi:MAG: hypothetical protein WD049_04195 [Candidatus Paceibacterota bacterium]
MTVRARRRAAQRKAFVAYLKRVKPVEETWTGWKKALVLQGSKKTYPMKLVDAKQVFVEAED